MDLPTPEEIVATIEQNARDLVMFAAYHGHVLTIEMKPTEKLAMGSYTPEIGLRPARGPGVLARIQTWYALRAAGLDPVRFMSASHADKSRTECGDAPDMRASQGGGHLIKLTRSQREVLRKVVAYALKKSDNLLQREADPALVADFGTPSYEAALDIMQRANGRIMELASAIEVKYDPPATQHQLAETEIAVLIEALDGQAATIRAVRSSLDKQRNRQNEPLPSRYHNWVAEEAMGERLELIAKLADQLQKTSTLGRVLLQYPQR